MNDPGFERTLRHALHTELNLRLRHTLLHGLKGPVQTILSALHLMQKKALAGETQDLEKYATWIKDAAKDMGERAQEVLPPKPRSPGESANFDLHALTENAAHILRDEGALKNVELIVAPPSSAVLARGNDGDMQLALLAMLLRIVDASPADSPVLIAVENTAAGVQWSAAVAGGDKPDTQAFELRYDVPPPQSGIAWAVARDIVLENGGTFSIDGYVEQGGWRLVFTVPRA